MSHAADRRLAACSMLPFALRSSNMVSWKIPWKIPFRHFVRWFSPKAQPRWWSHQLLHPQSISASTYGKLVTLRNTKLVSDALRICIKMIQNASQKFLCKCTEVIVMDPVGSVTCLLAGAGMDSSPEKRKCTRWWPPVVSGFVSNLHQIIKYMAVDLNSFICELPLFANKQSTFANLSRTPRLSFAGVSCENISLNHAKSVYQNMTFASSGKKLSRALMLEPWRPV